MEPEKKLEVAVDEENSAEKVADEENSADEVAGEENSGEEVDVREINSAEEVAGRELEFNSAEEVAEFFSRLEMEEIEKLKVAAQIKSLKEVVEVVKEDFVWSWKEINKKEIKKKEINKKEIKKKEINKKEIKKKEINKKEINKKEINKSSYSDDSKEIVPKFLCWKCNTLIALGSNQILDEFGMVAEIDVENLEERHLLFTTVEFVNQEQNTTRAQHKGGHGLQIETDDAKILCDGCDSRVGWKLAAVYGDHALIREGRYIVVHGTPHNGVFYTEM